MVILYSHYPFILSVPEPDILYQNIPFVLYLYLNIPAVCLLLYRLPLSFGHFSRDTRQTVMEFFYLQSTVG